jgi:16S rRNA C1402 N4-methylase RsmH
MCGDKIPVARYLHKSVIVPSREEVRANPRSRSAKLRVVERMDTNE